MIEYINEQRDELRALIAERAPRYGFSFTGTDLIPPSIAARKQDMRINMFLAIGINSTGRCKSFISIRDFIRKGINRFFKSLQNRMKLNVTTITNNVYEGRDLICADFYVGPAVFDCVEVPDDVLNEWNAMMKNIRVLSRHGIKVTKNYSADNTTVKYLWVDRPCKK